MTDPRQRSTRALWLGRVVAALGHSCAVLLLTVASVLVLVPHAAASRIAGWIFGNRELLDMTVVDMAIHVLLCACLWAFCVLMFAHVRQRVRSVRHVSLKPTRGTVVTETLIVLPLFLLMTFGMSQLCINSIAGVLMNVAAFQSARAYWVWQPEMGGARASGADAELKAQMAAAAVMTPVAPGDFMSITDLDGNADKLRIGLAASNIPFAEAIPSDVTALLADLAALNLRRTTRRNRSFWRALDSQSFAQRSVTKFTHAFYSTSIEPQTGSDRLGVKVTYQHNQVMPFVARLFGEPVLDGPGMRAGYYATYERTYTYRAQIAKPNSNMPKGNESAGAYPTEDDGEGGIRDQVGDGDF